MTTAINMRENVWVIDDWDLRFICNLVLGIWLFFRFKKYIAEWILSARFPKKLLTYQIKYDGFTVCFFHFICKYFV